MKDGTYTYYDLWPNDHVGVTALQDDVKPDYSKGVKINSFNELMNSDPTTHREGNEAPEKRSADGIVQLPTTAKQDSYAKIQAEFDIRTNKQYDACYNSCATYAQRILNASGVTPPIDGSQELKVPLHLKTTYNDAKLVAPNDLYNAALKVKGAVNIKGPSKVDAKPFLQYFGY